MKISHKHFIDNQEMLSFDYKNIFLQQGTKKKKFYRERSHIATNVKLVNLFIENWFAHNGSHAFIKSQSILPRLPQSAFTHFQRSRSHRGGRWTFFQRACVATYSFHLFPGGIHSRVIKLVSSCGLLLFGDKSIAIEESCGPTLKAVVAKF